MKYSIEQSEITERTEQINKFALLVDLFNKKAVDRETFMAELSKIELTDWAKENLFNQLIGYCVLGDAYGILKSRELEYFIMNTYKNIIKETANRLPGVKHEFESPV